MFVNCLSCQNYDHCDQFERWNGGCINHKPRPQSNADRIRAMSDDELAVVIAWPYLASPPWCSEHTTCPYISEDPTPCDKCALDWLKQEAEEGET